MRMSVSEQHLVFLHHCHRMPIACYNTSSPPRNYCNRKEQRICSNLLFSVLRTRCRPAGPESDTVSLLLINGQIMVDTGWHPVHNLMREGVPVENVHARSSLRTCTRIIAWACPQCCFTISMAFTTPGRSRSYGPTGLTRNGAQGLGLRGQISATYARCARTRSGTYAASRNEALQTCG